MSGHSTYPSPDRGRASILVVALWSLCLLSVFAVTLNYQIRSSLTLASRLDQRSRLRLSAQAGIYRGMTEVASDPEKTYFSLGDSWSNNPGLFKDIEIGGVGFTLSYVYPDSAGGLSHTGYGCTDEEGKLNINKADLNTMSRLFKAVLSLEETAAQELAACILDWRDSDSQLSLPVGSAEDFYYGSLPNPYAAKNKPLETIDELLLVKGINQNVFEKLKDYVTIYGDGMVNANTAPVAVLYAVGLDEEMAQKIASVRAGEDESQGTLDDRPFVSQADIVSAVTAAFSLTQAQVEQLSQVTAASLSVSSKNFSAHCQARAGNYTLSVESVFTGQGKIVYWREI